MRCWSCQKRDMEPAHWLGEGWLKCLECGATFTEVPEPSGSKLAVETIGGGLGSKYKAHPITKADRERAKRVAAKYNLEPLFPATLRKEKE